MKTVCFLPGHEERAKSLNITPKKLDQMMKRADPTGGKYKKYILKLLNNNEIILPEDAKRVSDLILKFQKFQGQLKERDILRYSSLHDLEVAIEDLEGVGAGSKRQGALQFDPVSLPGVELVARDGKLFLYKVTSEDSLAKLGEGTKWCTRYSYDGNSKIAASYMRKHKRLFVVFEGRVPVAQYTPDFEHLMDRNDRSLI